MTCFQIQNEVTLKSKLRADHRNSDLQRRHDALKKHARHTQQALESSQVKELQCLASLTALQMLMLCHSVRPLPFLFVQEHPSSTMDNGE